MKALTAGRSCILSNNPKGAAINLPRLDFWECLKELFSDRWAQIWKLLDDLAITLHQQIVENNQTGFYLPDERDDINRSRVVRFSQELHERMHDARSNL